MPSMVMLPLTPPQLHVQEQLGLLAIVVALATRKMVAFVTADGKHALTLLFIKERQAPLYVLRVAVNPSRNSARSSGLTGLVMKPFIPASRH